MRFRPIFFLLSLGLLALLSGCAGPEPYRYKYIRGKTAILRNGYAIAPRSAPAAVHRAIAAGNRIAGLPYAYGGGHGRGIASAYDCSGAASFVCRERASYGVRCRPPASGSTDRAVPGSGSAFMRGRIIPFWS